MRPYHLQPVSVLCILQKQNHLVGFVGWEIERRKPTESFTKKKVAEATKKPTAIQKESSHKRTNSSFHAPFKHTNFEANTTSSNSQVHFPVDFI